MFHICFTYNNARKKNTQWNDWDSEWNDNKKYELNKSD